MTGTFELSDDVRQVQALYDRGLFLQAYERSKPLGPLRNWTEPRARVLAGRLVGNLGDRRLAQALFYRAWRADHDDPIAQLSYAQTLSERAGPLAAWAFLQAQDEHAEVPAATRARSMSLRALVLGMLRDFDRAEGWLVRAEQLVDDDPWIVVERAILMALEDRYEESLEAADRSLVLRPHYAPAAHARVNALVHLGREDDALVALRAASDTVEAFWLTEELVWMLMAREEYGAAAAAAERLVTLSPALSPKGQERLNAIRSDVAYHLGDIDAARELAARAGTPFHRGLAERLAVPPERTGRARLAVPFVAQHFLTCGPATLTSIARFWSMPVDHLDVVEAIWYGGTWDHTERHWADTNGWIAREFRVTWETSIALLDRGFPFALASVHPTSAHLQAVVGYDVLRGTLLIQDPSVGPTEYAATELFEAQRPTGPRGLVLVPIGMADRLGEVDLPDAALYDHLYRLRRALVNHDRDGAERERAALAASAPAHALVQYARWELARYDGDPMEGLGGVESLLAIYPRCEHFELRKLSYLRDLGRREERLALLDEVAARPGCDPIWWQQAAEEHRLDARDWVLAERLARRTLKRMPTAAAGYYTLAALRRDQHRFEEALELMRFAVCLDPTDEGLSDTYFHTACLLKSTDEALALLRGRVERYGRQSGQPGRTLHLAFARVHRLPEAFAALDHAMVLRPGDGELTLFAARQRARHGHSASASTLLERARGSTRASAWMRSAADVALAGGDTARALGLWREVAANERFAVDAHREIANLLNDREGRRAAVGHLRAASAAIPYYLPLRQLLVEWLRSEGLDEWEGELRDLLARHPSDAWALRDLAVCLRRQHRRDEAKEVIEDALALEPLVSFAHMALAQILADDGDVKAARQAYRAAIRLDVDNRVAVVELVRGGEDDAERRDALAFVRDELRRQVVFGDGLVAYREAARAVLTGEDVLALLREALEARPDLVMAWSQVVGQLIDLDRAEEAVVTARRGIERFPLTAQMRVDLARACRAAGDHEAEVAALREAIEISPGWVWAVRELALSLQNQRRYEEARDILETAVTSGPRDPQNHGCLADVLWALDDRVGALDAIEQSLRIASDYGWAWDRLREWALAAGDGDRVIRLARALSAEHPGDPVVWRELARRLHGMDALDERLAALDRALALDPRSIEIHDIRAVVLTEAGRFAEALESCRPAVFEPIQPAELRARAAWIAAEQGDLPTARARIREVLERDAHYYEGWKWLVSWCEDEGDAEEAKKAGLQLIRLEPGRADAWAYLGGAALAGGQRAEAKAALSRALELSPDYLWAGFTLFDARLEDGELDEAEALLGRLLEGNPGEFAIARLVLLAARRGQAAVAEERLREIAAGPSEETWPLQAAIDAMVEAGWAAAVDRVLESVVKLGAPTTRLVAGWAARCASRRSSRAAVKAILPACRNRSLGGRAAAAFIEHAVALGSRDKIERLRAACPELFRSDVEVWGSYGFALAELGDLPATVRWLDDWASREGVNAWMLVNLAIGLRSAARWPEADRIHRHALSLAHDHSHETLLAWVIWEDALAGQVESARELRQALASGKTSAYVAFVLGLGNATLEARGQTGAADPGRFRRARVILAEAVKAYPIARKNVELRLAAQRTRRRIADIEGSRWTRLLRRLTPWLD